MALLQGGNLGIDMFSGFYGQVVIARADLIQVSYGPGWIGNYWGTFQYSGPSAVTGTVNVYEEVMGGERIVAATGFTASAATVIDLVARDDTLGVLNLVFSGGDSISGSTAGDLLVGLNGNDTVDGRAGADDVNGNMGNDIVGGGEGADWVRGGQGDDTIFGEAGSDPHVNGNLGNDYVSGGDGDDTCFGGQGVDTIYGNAGNDRLTGDLGIGDYLYGGAGADLFVLQLNTQFDIAMDFNAAEGDRIAIPAGYTYSLSSQSGSVVVILNGGDSPVMGLLGVSPAQFQSSWVVQV